jgi:hypothetical protein
LAKLLLGEDAGVTQLSELDELVGDKPAAQLGSSRARRLRGCCGVEVWVRSEPGFDLFCDAMVHADRRQLCSVTHDPKRAFEHFRSLTSKRMGCLERECPRLGT